MKKAELLCPECNGNRLIRDNEKGEILCGSCGLIIEENLTDSGAMRNFELDPKLNKSRSGAPLKFTNTNKGLTTHIDKTGRDIRGGRISSEKKAQINRMILWHNRTLAGTSFERNLSVALDALDRFAFALGLPENIKERIAYLYRQAASKGLIRGRRIESIVAAIVYGVCRMQGIPRTLDEISDEVIISKKDIGRAYRFIKAELEFQVPLADPSQYISKFANALNLDGQVQEDAVKLIRKAVKKGLVSGRGPSGVAAAALYISSAMRGYKKTQKEVSDVAGVTEVTIRNHYRDFVKELGLKVDLI